MSLKEENNFSFDLGAFHHLINDHTRLVILNSPSNPTGGVMPKADLEEIVSAAQQFDFWVMSDEIYAMTGRRLGYGIMHECLAQVVQLLLTIPLAALPNSSKLPGSKR